MCTSLFYIYISPDLPKICKIWPQFLEIHVPWSGSYSYRRHIRLIRAFLKNPMKRCLLFFARLLSSFSPQFSKKFYNFARNFAELESNGFKHRGTMITLFKAYIKSWCENDENLVISESEKRAHPQIPNPKMSRIHPIGRRKTPSQFFVEYFIKGCGFLDFWWFYSSLRVCSRFCTCFSILLTISVDFCRFHVRFNW